MRPPPALLLHGLASKGSRFAEFCAHTALAPRHRLLAPGSLPQPVLALLSTVATSADAAQMRAALAGPRAEVQAMGCHHWPLTEPPAEVRRAIEAWGQAQARGLRQSPAA
jgi:pimeloyl-ACP methyl ester carboxylesterase